MAASDADRSAGGLRAAAYRAVLRPVLFRAGGSDAERAHQRTLAGLSRAARSPRLLRLMSRLTRADPGPRRVFGVDFPAVTGLAAGMDKDAVALKAWPALGFGHVEVGTVTAHAQPGNARPRLFRLVESGAVINRMGFNNAGAVVLAETLRAAGPIGIPVGVSLGKSKVTPVQAAVGDYLTSLRHVYRHADYVAVNVSSPNTPGLRTLQDAGPLDELLGALTAEAGTLAAQDGSPDHPAVPVLVKIAPDLTDEAIDELLGVCVDHGIAGLIATNTTIGRPGIAAAETTLGAETGGLSGRPLTARALRVVRYVAAATDLPVIAVGGIMTVDDGLRMLDAGASLLQVYTGFIYAGPPLVTGLNRAAARQAAANPVP